MPQNNYIGILAAFYLLFASSGYLLAQESRAQGSDHRGLDGFSTESIAHILKDAGFLDAACLLEDDQLRIVYSRSRYRPGAQSTRKLIAALDSLPQDKVSSLHITVNDRNLPVYYYQIPVVDGRPVVADTDYAISQLTHQEPSLQKASGKLSNFTLLFSLDPQFRFAFGANPDPVQVQFNLLPSLAAQLWKGSLLRFQYIIPVWNELDIPEEDQFRPGLITFSQNIRLGRGFFATLNLGYFTNYRYGSQIELGKFLWKDQFYLGAALGYTGYASWPRRLSAETPQPGWEFSDLGYLDYRFTAGWRWHPYDLQILATYGMGLNDQEYAMMAIARQFKQTTFEIFAQKLDNDYNYGIRLKIPIPFYRLFVGNRLTLQSGDFLDFRYNGTQYYHNTYHIGQNFPPIWDNLHPELIFDL